MYLDVNEIIEQYSEEAELMLLEPRALFDSCVVGIAHGYGMNPRVCYSKQKIIEILTDDETSREDAEEYFSYNIIGAWVGEGTPCFLSGDH